MKRISFLILSFFILLTFSACQDKPAEEIEKVKTNKTVSEKNVEKSEDNKTQLTDVDETVIDENRMEVDLRNADKISDHALIVFEIQKVKEIVDGDKVKVLVINDFNEFQNYQGIYESTSGGREPIFLHYTKDGEKYIFEKVEHTNGESFEDEKSEKYFQDNQAQVKEFDPQSAELMQKVKDKAKEIGKNVVSLKLDQIPGYQKDIKQFETEDHNIALLMTNENYDKYKNDKATPVEVIKYYKNEEVPLRINTYDLEEYLK